MANVNTAAHRPYWLSPDNCRLYLGNNVDIFVATRHPQWARGYPENAAIFSRDVSSCLSPVKRSNTARWAASENASSRVS